MSDIFENAINDGLAANGLSTTVAPVTSQPAAPNLATPPAKVDTTPPTLEVKADVKPDAPVEDKVSVDDFAPTWKKAEIKSAETKQNDVTPTAPEVASRDTVLVELQIPKEQWPLFRKMGNESFNHVKGILLKQRETEAELTNLKKAPAQNANTIPASYYEHEDGYTLHPEVRKAQGTAQQASFELKHWQDQWVKIEAGEDWLDLDIDAKGQYVTKAMQPSSQAKLAIMGYMQQAKQVLGEQSQFINNVKSQWKQYHQQYVNGFKQSEDTYFPQYAKTTDNAYINTMSKLLAEKGQGTNPLSGMFAKMYAFTMEQKAELDTLKANRGTKVNAQPPASAFNGAGGSRMSDDDKVSVDMFKQVMERR